MILLGFGNSYFSKFFSGTNDFHFYFHFHAVMMSLWVLSLIVQPLLFRRKKLALHKLIGKFSYVLMPLIFISVILLAHAQGQRGLEVVDGKIILDGPPPHLLIPFKDLILIGTMFIIAIVIHRDVNIHARAMIATGIVFRTCTSALSDWADKRYYDWILIDYRYRIYAFNQHNYFRKKTKERQMGVPASVRNVCSAPFLTHFSSQYQHLRIFY